MCFWQQQNVFELHQDTILMKQLDMVWEGYDVLTSKQTNKQTRILIYRYHKFVTNLKVRSHLMFKDSIIKSRNTKLAI
jgi:hypothetical protein